jgi:hypothetical protein
MLPAPCQMHWRPRGPGAAPNMLATLLAGPSAPDKRLEHLQRNPPFVLVLAYFIPIRCRLAPPITKINACSPPSTRRRFCSLLGCARGTPHTHLMASLSM